MVSYLILIFLLTDLGLRLYSRISIHLRDGTVGAGTVQVWN